MQLLFPIPPGHMTLGTNTDYKKTNCSPRRTKMTQPAIPRLRFSQEAEPWLTPIAPMEMDRSNKPQITRMTRIFFCRGSRVDCDRQSTIKLATGRVRPTIKHQTSNIKHCSRAFTLPKQRERVSAFTLIELLVVMAIIAILLLLVAPAFTNLKSAGDVTSAAYTVKGVLDTARTYAMSHNTYTWVGFYEENVANPVSPNSDAPKVGRLIMSIVASKDGTTAYDPNNLTTIAPTKLIQVGKLIKIENLHLATFTDGSGTGTTFDTRPSVTYDTARIGDTTPPDPSLTPFQYPVGNPAPAAQYTFVKAVQFSPRGEARIDNTNYSLKTAAEIGLRATHGTTVDTGPNAVAIQFGGVGGDVIVYRK
jgi:prepilin-type N-terminal cleavage/methylation domain-containing protein